MPRNLLRAQEQKVWYLTSMVLSLCLGLSGSSIWGSLPLPSCRKEQKGLLRLPASAPRRICRAPFSLVARMVISACSWAIIRIPKVSVVNENTFSDPRCAGIQVHLESAQLEATLAMRFQLLTCSGLHIVRAHFTFSTLSQSCTVGT